jgi:TPR repeat protein/predicted RNA-binding Zn-ribbon protein involved in translation (DUF1610 family)
MFWKCQHCGLEKAESSIAGQCPRCGNSDLREFLPPKLQIIRDATAKGDWKSALRLLTAAMPDFHEDAPTTINELTHELCGALLTHSKNALAANEFQKALELAEKVLTLKADNSDAALIRSEAQAKLKLTDLAIKACKAYKSQNLSACQSACEAYVKQQRASGAHIEFDDGSGNVIDIAGLPAKLRMEIARQARLRKAARRRRFIKRAAVFLVIIVGIALFAYWRQSVFQERVKTFDAAMHAGSFEQARVLAPKIARKHKPASDLLGYFTARASFESAIRPVAVERIQQYAPTQFAEVQELQASATKAVNQPSQGIQYYNRAATHLAECLSITEAGEKARLEREASERAAAQAEEQRQRERAERVRDEERRNRENLHARIRGQVEHIVKNMSQENSIVNILRSFPATDFSSWLQAGEQGLSEGMLLAGIALLNGVHTQRDENRGEALIRQAADQGIGLAEFLMAITIDVKRYPRRQSEVVQWMTRAANNDIAPAQASVGLWHFHGTHGLPKNTNEAFRRFSAAAVAGEDSAQYHLALCYYEGISVRKNIEQAVYWMREAAGRGNDYAQYFLADMYRFGVGVRQDHREAALWYKRAAAQGHPNAQNDLGVAYVRGDGVNRNIDEAIRLFRLSARQGNQTAIENLQGLEVPPVALLYKCPSCGRTTRVDRRPAVNFACRNCPWADMQYAGPVY